MLDISLGHFMQHVGDLEEWNEDAGFEWGTPTIVHNNELVTVVHPMGGDLPPAPRTDKEVHTTVIAVYQQDGTKVALWIIDKDGSAPHVDTNYWTTPHAHRAFEERTAVFRGREASVGETVWDEKADRVWTCTKVINREENG